jgi:TolB-like protein/Tfp pilus assembly protein PilF
MSQEETGRRSLPVELGHEPDFALGPVVVRPSLRQIEGATGKRTVEPRVMQALVALTHAAGSVVSRDDLIRRCWSGRVVGDDAINNCIGKVRRLGIADSETLYTIETIPRIGYRLTLAEASSRAPAEMESALPDKPSLAVLPFENLSGDPAQQYYSDGITEDIITELSRFRTISVIARNSSFLYRDRPTDATQIARDLHVQFVVEGSVRRLEKRVRITVQLVNAETRRQVWGERYDIEQAEIFALQDDVTRRIVATLIPRIEVDALESSRRRPTDQPRAYDCYLQGKALLYAAQDHARVVDARRKFEEAVAIDPQFARPYCYLAKIDNTAFCHTVAGTPLAPLRERAWQFAMRAAALDDSDPRTQLTLAWCHLWRREFEAVRKHLDIAIKLNPNDSEQRIDCGTTLMYLGEPEAGIAVMTAAMQQNPFHPDWYLGDLGEVYFAARMYDSAIALFEKIADPSPLYASWRAAAYAYLGRDADARREAERFTVNMRAIWVGDPSAAPSAFVDWLFLFRPFRRREDADHLVEGLCRAGLSRSS